LSPVNGSPSDKITMAALYPRYAAFLHAGDAVVLETGSSSLGVTPTILPDGVRVEAQVLWGSIGWATPAAFGVALADPSRRTILITGEGSTCGWRAGPVAMAALSRHYQLAQTGRLSARRDRNRGSASTLRLAAKETPKLGLGVESLLLLFHRLL